MEDNETTIIDKHFQVYTDSKCKDHGKQTCEVCFSLISKSGVHVLYNGYENNDLYLLSMEIPNTFSIKKKNW